MVVIKYVLKFLIFVFHRFFLNFYLRKENFRNNRVLIQVNSGIGDCICALPMIRKLASAKFEVYALVNEVTADIIKLCPDVKSYFIISNRNMGNPFQVLNRIGTLWKPKFNYYIGASPSNVIRYIFLPLILRIPNRIKHYSPHKEWFRNYDFLFNKLGKISHNQHIAIANVRLLELMNLKFNNFRVNYEDNIKLPSITLQNVQKKLLHLNFNKEKKTIGIHPGCKTSWNFKRWPAEKFGELINLLLQNDKIQVILFGGYDDVIVKDKILLFTNCRPINLVNKLSLEETICAISLCDLFVSNDSGLMHIATLLNIPVVGIFGGKSNELLTGPLGEKHTVIKKNNIDDITVSEVMEVVMKKLDQ